MPRPLPVEVTVAACFFLCVCVYNKTENLCYIYKLVTNTSIKNKNWICLPVGRLAPKWIQLFLYERQAS